MSNCKCSMTISINGDGCRYCQSQECIDRLAEWLEESRTDCASLEAECGRLRDENRDLRIEADGWFSALRPAEFERDAALAECERLREALQNIASIENRYNCGDWDEIEDARNIAKAALSAKP